MTWENIWFYCLGAFIGVVINSDGKTADSMIAVAGASAIIALGRLAFDLWGRK